jgi:hypothetical protein
MTDYIKNKIESQRKIQFEREIEFERDREYVNKILQKVIVHVELDPELLKKIDQEAAKDLRTRKAQVLYILREHFKD